MLGYARPSDYVAGATTAAAGPGLMLLWERVAPSFVGKGGFAPIMRLAGVIGAGAGFFMVYQRSICAFISSLYQILSMVRAVIRLEGKLEKNYHTDGCSAILWLCREQARAGDGYEGDGSESESG